jgi:hypothetical protein
MAKLSSIAIPILTCVLLTGCQGQGAPPPPQQRTVTGTVPTPAVTATTAPVADPTPRYTDRTTAPAVLPTAVTDVLDHGPRAVLLAGRGAPPRIPWYEPAPDATLMRNTSILHVRARTLPMPRQGLVAVAEDGLLVVDGDHRVTMRGFDGSRRLIGLIPSLRWAAGLDGRLLAWMTSDGEGGWRFARMWTGDGTVVESTIAELGAAPGPVRDIQPVAFLGGTDVVYRAQWSNKRRSAGYFRTSERPARWHLTEISAVSTGARLIAGSPMNSARGECMAVYRYGGTRPLWTRCFTQGKRRGSAHIVEFSPDGRLLLAQATERHGPYAPSRDDVLLLDARTGRTRHRFEYDMNYGSMEFEDNEHVMITSDDAPRGDPMTESSFHMWLTRCTLSGECQDATARIPTSNYLGYVGALAPR